MHTHVYNLRRVRAGVAASWWAFNMTKLLSTSCMGILTYCLEDNTDAHSIIWCASLCASDTLYVSHECCETPGVP